MSVDTEDARRVRVKRAVSGEIGDRGGPLKMRIDADKRLGPEPLTGIDRLLPEKPAGLPVMRSA